MKSLLDVKDVTFDVTRRTLQERVGREVLNTEVEVESFLDYMVIRLTQRMLAKQADESRLDGVETQDSNYTTRVHEAVPANWWSHILVAIVGGVTVDYGWRWALLKHAKLLDVVLVTNHYHHTTHTHVTRFTRMCPHVHIPDDHFHLRWLFNVNDETLKGEK